MQQVRPLGAQRVALEPLKCSSCGAPIPLGDASSVSCPSCGTVNALPQAYRELRDGARLADADREMLAAQYAAASRPPPLVVRLWAGAGRFVMGAWGAATVCVIVVVIAGMYVSSPRDFWSLAVLAAIVELLIGVPAGIDWQLHRLGAHGYDMADALGMWIGLLLSVAAYVFVFAPWVLLRYCRNSTDAITRLQQALGARPPAQPGGVATCRNCGAALDVPPGALGARCMYCRTDNLVRVAGRKAHAEHKAKEKFHREVVSALAQHDAERQERREALPGRLVSAGVKTLFAVMLMTYAGRCTEENGHITAANLHRASAEEGKLFPGIMWPEDNHLQVVKQNQKVTSKSDSVYERDFDVQSYRVALERGQRLVTHVSNPEISFDLYRHDISWRQFTSDNYGWVKDNAAKRFAPYTGWYKLAIHRHATKREVKRANGDHTIPPFRFTWSWTTSPP